MQKIVVPHGLLADETFLIHRWFAFSLVLLLTIEHRLAKSAETKNPVDQPQTRELLRDRHFQQGFSLLEVSPGRRVKYGEISGPSDSAPVWDLDQWSSKFPLVASNRPPENSELFRYSNAAKTVVIRKLATNSADLAFAVNASAEYPERSRRSGEPWVHLLAEQYIESPPRLAELSRLQIHVKAKLTASRTIEQAGYSLDLHAAQFQIFLSVQNRNADSPGFGKYLWFGVPVYNNRHEVVPSHAAVDGYTQMFIYTPSSDHFTDRSAHGGDWITIDKDLLPLIHAGLEAARKAGHLKDSLEPSDYAVQTINLGWELPGTFDVEMQIRDLSLKAVGRR